MAEPQNVVVIGSGAAGSGAARALATAGWRVTMIERDRVGGTCLWRGCMPKKALYTSAKMMRFARDADRFGIDLGEPSADWQAVLAWKWHAQESYAGDQEGILADRDIELVRGDARFASADSIMVDGREISMDACVLATGSVPREMGIPGEELADTSETALRYPELPKHLVIIGGGYIGMEFAGIFASLGSKVTVVMRDAEPLPALDPDAVAVARRRLEHVGVRFIPNARVTALAGEPGDIAVEITGIESGESATLGADHVLSAIGRVPASRDLDLDAGGIEVDERGRIVADSYLRTTNPKVWVAGDVAGGMMQTPVASYEGRTVAASIQGNLTQPECHLVPTTVFTIPQLAQVGLTEAQATAQGIEYKVAHQSFEYLGAAIIENKQDGMVKLLFSADDDRLLGVHIAGPTASDLTYGLAVAMRAGATSAMVRDTMGVHPAYNELVNWAAWI